MCPEAAPSRDPVHPRPRSRARERLRWHRLGSEHLAPSSLARPRRETRPTQPRSRTLSPFFPPPAPAPLPRCCPARSLDQDPRTEEADLDSKRQRANTFLRLVFGLPDEEALLEDFSCAYRGQILQHGRMYITTSTICFYSNLFGSETKKILPFRFVVDLQKKTVALMFSTLEITIERDGVRKAYVFSSFFGSGRNLAFDLCGAQLHRWKPDLAAALHIPPPPPTSMAEPKRAKTTKAPRGGARAPEGSASPRGAAADDGSGGAQTRRSRRATVASPLRRTGPRPGAAGAFVDRSSGGAGAKGVEEEGDDGDEDDEDGEGEDDDDAEGEGDGHRLRARPDRHDRRPPPPSRRLPPRRDPESTEEFTDEVGLDEGGVEDDEEYDEEYDRDDDEDDDDEDDDWEGGRGGGLQPHRRGQDRISRGRSLHNLPRAGPADLGRSSSAILSSVSLGPGRLSASVRREGGANEGATPAGSGTPSRSASAERLRPSASPTASEEDEDGDSGGDGGGGGGDGNGGESPRRRPRRRRSHHDSFSSSGRRGRADSDPTGTVLRRSSQTDGELEEDEGEEDEEGDGGEEEEEERVGGGGRGGKRGDTHESATSTRKPPAAPRPSGSGAGRVRRIRAATAGESVHRGASLSNPAESGEDGLDLPPTSPQEPVRPRSGTSPALQPTAAPADSASAGAATLSSSSSSSASASGTATSASAAAPAPSAPTVDFSSLWPAPPATIEQHLADNFTHLTDATITVSSSAVFRLFLADDAALGITEFLRIQGMQEIDAEPWQTVDGGEASGGGGGAGGAGGKGSSSSSSSSVSYADSPIVVVPEGHEGHRGSGTELSPQALRVARAATLTKTVRYRMPLKPGPLMPKDTRVEKILRCQRFRDGTLVVDTSARSFDVPYGDYFTTEDQMLVRPVAGSGSAGASGSASGSGSAGASGMTGAAGASSCLVKFGARAAFTRFTLLKSTITSRAIEGMREFYASWIQEATTFLARLPPPAPAPAPAPTPAASSAPSPAPALTSTASPASTTPPAPGPAPSRTSTSTSPAQSGMTGGHRRSPALAGAALTTPTHARAQSSAQSLRQEGGRGSQSPGFRLDEQGQRGRGADVRRRRTRGNGENEEEEEEEDEERDNGDDARGELATRTGGRDKANRDRARSTSKVRVSAADRARRDADGDRGRRAPSQAPSSASAATGSAAASAATGSLAAGPGSAPRPDTRTWSLDTFREEYDLLWRQAHGATATANASATASSTASVVSPASSTSSSSSSPPLLLRTPSSLASNLVARTKFYQRVYFRQLVVALIWSLFGFYVGTSICSSPESAALLPLSTPLPSPLSPGLAPDGLALDHDAILPQHEHQHQLHQYQHQHQPNHHHHREDGVGGDDGEGASQCGVAGVDTGACRAGDGGTRGGAVDRGMQSGESSSRGVEPPSTLSSAVAEEAFRALGTLAGAGPEEGKAGSGGAPKVGAKDPSAIVDELTTRVVSEVMARLEGLIAQRQAEKEVHAEASASDVSTSGSGVNHSDGA